MSDEMISEFGQEAEELFSEAEECLLGMEKTTDYHASFNSVFRTFHSIKGAAGMFGLERLQEHMHIVENMLEGKKENTSMSTGMVDYLLSSIDAARKILDGDKIEFN